MSQPPTGLFYYPNIISANLATRLNKFLNSDDCKLFPVSNNPNARQVAHFGYMYDYKKGSTSNPAPEFPPILQELCSLIYDTHKFPEEYKFDQCIINRYLPGQGINAHYDREEYGEYIACFTVGGGAEMEFTERRTPSSADPGKYTIYTEPQSLYIMSGSSRHDWLHQMRSRKSDPGHGQRRIRWSLTFRSVKN